MIKAIGNRVIVKLPDCKERVSKGGIILPETKQEWHEGTVEAVGAKVKDIKKGDLVKVRGFEGLDFEYNNETFLIMSEHEVIAVVDDEPKKIRARAVAGEGC